MNAADKTARKQRGKPFERGSSGNPSGRPRGAKSRATLFEEAVSKKDATDVITTVVTAARGGDMAACRLVLDRVAPARKGQPLIFDLPKIESAADIATAMAALVAAVAGGKISPAEANEVAGIIDANRRALETGELEARIKKLEGGQNGNRT